METMPDAMRSVAEHYDRHLGPVYRWMLGDIDAARRRAAGELEDAALTRPGVTQVAIDLGAGLGLHAIALASLGFEVVAIEASAAMAAELRRDAASLPVRVVEDDLSRFRAHAPGQADVILCMGDTLTHLRSLEAVEQLLDEAAATLAPTGVFVATFRDYVSTELTGPARFLAVRSDDRRILTCFLEFHERTVLVHDVLHERDDDGAWRMRASSYEKLRLDPEWVVRRLIAAGLAAHRDNRGPAGMVRVVARRPMPSGAKAGSAS